VHALVRVLVLELALEQELVLEWELDRLLMHRFHRRHRKL
jgi:hypothetical protein